MKDNTEKIIQYLKEHPNQSSKEIFDNVDLKIAYASLKRRLTKLKNNGFIETNGKGRSTKYLISTSYNLIRPIDITSYFEKEIDERKIISSFNTELITNTLKATPIFSLEEKDYLQTLQEKYTANTKTLTKNQYNNELERLAIDLSWKSSQIEGNTYSLLETERLLKEKETASGKSKDEAVMLLNHKEAIDFIIENPNYLTPLTVRNIENIHSILIKELGIDRNIRTRRVGISGTNYKPLDNEFQIKEALEQTCNLVNNKICVFEKAFLTLLLLSYIQAFNDGNKRTARIVSNAILISNNYCPISFRTIDSIEYKKAMLVFYEQNNISVFKDIFIKQFEFAVNTYF